MEGTIGMPVHTAFISLIKKSLFILFLHGDNFDYVQHAIGGRVHVGSRDPTYKYRMYNVHYKKK